MLSIYWGISKKLKAYRTVCSNNLHNKFHGAIFFVFYNISQPNFVVLKCFFKLWWKILFFLPKPKFSLLYKLSIEILIIIRNVLRNIVPNLVF